MPSEPELTPEEPKDDEADKDDTEDEENDDDDNDDHPDDSASKDKPDDKDPSSGAGTSGDAPAGDDLFFDFEDVQPESTDDVVEPDAPQNKGASESSEPRVVESFGPEVDESEKRQKKKKRSRSARKPKRLFSSQPAILLSDAPEKHADWFVKGKFEEPERYLINLGKTEYDKKGNKSGIYAWKYDGKKEVYMVLRCDGSIEYYENERAFSSWTMVDLIQLDQATFYNPSQNDRARNFRDYLHRQRKRNFPDMKMVKPKRKEVLDPKTNEVVNVAVWPPTKKMKTVPLLPRFPEDSLKDFVMWAFDHLSAEVCIQTKSNEFRIFDVQDLLRFGESDIKVLARNQLHCEPLFEEYSKGFIKMAAKIVEQRIWAGSHVKSAKFRA